MSQKKIRKPPAAETQPPAAEPQPLTPIQVKHGVLTPNDGSPQRVLLLFDRSVDTFTMEPAFAREIARMLIEDAAVAERRLMAIAASEPAASAPAPVQ